MAKKSRRTWFSYQILGLGIALVLLCFLLWILDYFISDKPTFLSYENILNIFIQTSIITIISVGMTFIIITGGIDFSVGSVVALCSMASGLSMLSILNMGDFAQIFFGIFIGLLIGSLIGFINGFVIVKGRIPPYIVTFSMLGIVMGLVIWLNGSQSVNLHSKITSDFLFIGNNIIFGIPFPFILALIIVGISYIILNNMRFGRYVIAVGASEDAAKLSGISVNKYKFLVYLVGGFLAGLAGIIYTSKLGYFNPDIGIGFELYAIASVIVGGTTLSGGKGTIIGTLFGALLIGVLDNGLTLLNMSDEIKQVFVGIIIISVVLLDRFRKMN